jgi:hypothetical protein
LHDTQQHAYYKDDDDHDEQEEEEETSKILFYACDANKSIKQCLTNILLCIDPIVRLLFLRCLKAASGSQTSAFLNGWKNTRFLIIRFVEFELTYRKANVARQVLVQLENLFFIRVHDNGRSDSF